MLEGLLDRYPISSEWSRPTLYLETATLGTLSLYLCGLAARSEDEVVTGSAADLTATPLRRAYFELIERTSLVSAGRDSRRKFSLRDANGSGTGRAPFGRVFSESRDPRVRYARSNGVAAAATWRSACRAAHWELLERDRILRSWYGETRPHRLALPPSPWRVALETQCDFQAFSFPPSRRSRQGAAVGVFAFPRTPGVALAYGFAAARNSMRAIDRAAAECLQRLGFLWGETIPTAQPAFAPTAEYHQEYYLQPSMHPRLRHWLAGEHARTPCKIAERTAAGRVLEFADLTPDELRGKLFVVKALPRSELDLTFGSGHPAVIGPLPDSFRVHPIP
jgi:hypothetical protein